MNTSNIKKLKIGGKELKSFSINGKVAWQGLPEFKVGDTVYNPDTFPFWLPIESNANVVFTNFDNSSYRLTVYLVGGGGGGGPAHARVYANPNTGTSQTSASGAGGEGGQVKTITPTVVENTTYPIVVGKGGVKGVSTITRKDSNLNAYTTNTTGGTGGDTSAFGTTAKGGKGASPSASGDTQATTKAVGATGNGGAKGGDGAQKTEDSSKPLPTSGATGTTINGTLYASGGNGGGYDFTYYYAPPPDYSWLVETNVTTNTATNSGHRAKGGGGNGAYVTTLRKSGNQGNVCTLNVSGAEDGVDGIVMFKIEEI